MEYIKLENWPRGEHFKFFSGLSFPFYNVTLPLDVTGLRAYTKVNKLSFYHALVYVVTTVMNGIPDFLYKIRPGGVVLLPRIHPSFVTLDPATHLFKIVTLELEPGMDLPAFCRAAAEAERAQAGYFPTAEAEARDDFIYFSCTPWFSFTSMSHEMNCDPNDSIPRVIWGKYEEKGGRVTLPFSVQFNHRLLDGYHLELLLEGIAAFLRESLAERVNL